MANPTNRGVNNTAFSPNPDKVAQITGSGQPVPGSVIPTYAATTSLDPVLTYSNFVNVVTNSTVGNATLTTGYVFNAGAQITVQISNDSGGARTITFGTGFRSTGTVVGTASKAILVTFTSDGTTLNEDGRTSAALT
jgi:hypothetical protein